MSYDYKNLKKFERGQIMGLTKRLAGIRFKVPNPHNTSDIWDALFKDAESLGLKIVYNDIGHGERLDFIKPRKITAEQTKFGKAWLKDFYFTKSGKPRRGKRTQYINQHELDIAKSVSRFEFVGVAVQASSGWYPCQVLPIYRAYNRKGESFDYAPMHWGLPLTNGGN